MALAPSFFNEHHFWVGVWRGGWVACACEFHPMQIPTRVSPIGTAHVAFPSNPPAHQRPKRAAWTHEVCPAGGAAYPDPLCEALAG